MKRIIALILATLMLGLCACGKEDTAVQPEISEAEISEEEIIEEEEETVDPYISYIEEKLNLANNAEQEWTYNENADAWVLSPVSAVAYPELPDQQGVSVCVPGAYVKGIDTNGDGSADVTTGTAKGALVIDYDATITSSNGQVYTAATAPVIINTGAAGYGSQSNSKASTSHAANAMYPAETAASRILPPTPRETATTPAMPLPALLTRRRRYAMSSTTFCLAICREMWTTSFPPAAAAVEPTQLCLPLRAIIRTFMITRSK